MPLYLPTAASGEAHAMQGVGSRNGVIVRSISEANTIAGTTRTLAAAGNELFLIGRLMLSTGPGTSKLISSAGGKIFFRVGWTITWANAGTTLRVGIQDLDAAGLNDLTFDVYDELVPGTDALTANTVKAVTMSTGSKTIADGDMVAVGMRMTTRAGADSVQIHGVSGSWMAEGVLFPYGSFGGATVGSNFPLMTVVFDDGTLGYMRWTELVGAGTSAVTAFASASTPDEYAATFTVPHKCAIDGVAFYHGSVARADDFEAILYSDPLGTPVAVATATVDATFSAVSAGWYWAHFSSYQTLEPNTVYGLAIRATTVNTFTLQYVLVVDAALKALSPFAALKWCSRTDQTGAFSEVNTLHMPNFIVSVSQLLG
jgi:hypothetical protein